MVVYCGVIQDEIRNDEIRYVKVIGNKNYKQREETMI